MNIKFGSICSGIESASIAWEPLGMSATWFSEIEKFPSEVLSYHWPNITNLGDMCLLPDMVANNLIKAPDILVGGTPCQAFSVAGLRKGLDDERGQLTLKYVELLNEIDKKRPGKECVAVWENVPGVLSSKDNAFGCFIGALAGESGELIPSGKKWSNAGCVYGPERTIAWRVLDAQYFGVAQRRRRVFVVASARKGFEPTQVLFESEGLRRDIAPSRETWEKTPGFTLSSFAGYREGVGTLRAAGGDQGGGSETLTLVDINHILPIHDKTTRHAGKTGKGSGNGFTLTTCDKHAISNFNIVRKLTPLECERLQGFPDNHTKISYRNKSINDCPDGPRYKAIGNSKAVPVIQWIGQQIIKELNKNAN